MPSQIYSLADLDMAEVHDIGNPWHGAVRHRRITVQRVGILNPAAALIRSGSPVTWPGGAGYVTNDAVTEIHLYTADTLEIGDILAIGTRTFAVDTLPGTTVLMERYVTTDQGSIDQPIAWQAAENSLAATPWIAIKYTKPGQPTVTTPPAESALGMEWRNFALCPGAFGFGNDFYPFTDAGGNTWIISQFVATLNSDASGSVAVHIIPAASMDVFGPQPAAQVVQTNYVTGTFPAGIDTGGLPMVAKLLDSKNEGRTWLFGVVSGTQDYDATLYGIYEIEISGTGSLDGGDLVGLSVSLTVVRSADDCTWTPDFSEIDPDDDSFSAYQYLPTPGQMASLWAGLSPEDPSTGWLSGSETFACKVRLAQYSLVGAWYDSGGTLVEVRLWMHLIKCISYHCTFQYKATYPAGSLFRDFDAVTSGNETRSYTIRVGTSKTAPVVLHTSFVYDYTGENDNSGLLLKDETLTLAADYVAANPDDSCDGLSLTDPVVLISRSSSQSFPAGTDGPGEIGLVDCVMPSNLLGLVDLHHINGMQTTDSVYPKRLFWVGVSHRSARCYGLAWAVSEDISGATFQPAIDDAGITGWASPTGITTGISAIDNDGLGVFDSYWPISSSYSPELVINGRYTSHNPNDNSTVVGELYPTFHV